MEREFLEIVKTITFFKNIIFGSHIEIITDSKNLLFDTDINVVKQQRWKLTLQDLDYIIFTKGKRTYWTGYNFKTISFKKKRQYHSWVTKT